VARHVVVQLFYNGNMDNTSVGENGEVVPERKVLGCLGRRELWTIYLYIAALVPALIVDDLGPVLSITGSLGASSLAYIAPGLVYLGVNGEDFIAWVGGAAQYGAAKRRSSSLTNGGDVELPVVGDSQAKMGEGTQSVPPEGMSGGRKRPWWWWPLAMPIWVAIASSGSRGTSNFLTNMGVQPLRGPSEDEEESIGPRKRDYVYSILFIIFGVVAMVAGIISNIYVQVNNIFFSP